MWVNAGGGGDFREVKRSRDLERERECVVEEEYRLGEENLMT